MVQVLYFRKHELLSWSKRVLDYPVLQISNWVRCSGVRARTLIFKWKQYFMNVLIWRLTVLILFDLIFEFPLTISASLQCLHWGEAPFLRLECLNLNISHQAIDVRNAPCGCLRQHLLLLHVCMIHFLCLIIPLLSHGAHIMQVTQQGRVLNQWNTLLLWHPLTIKIYRVIFYLSFQ